MTEIRLELGDSVEGEGPRPKGRNFSDEELLVLYSKEDDALMPTVARAAEVLAREWSSHADITEGPSRESASQISKSWERRADRLREQYAGAAASVTSGTRRRYDAYADAAEGTEYGG